MRRGGTGPRGFVGLRASGTTGRPR